MDKIRTILIVFCAFALGFGVNNYAISSALPLKVAKVDVQKLVMTNPQIIAIKKEQDRKATELQAWASNAQKQIDAQKDKAKKEALIKKYDKQLKDKMKLNASNQKKKLDAAEASINKTIETKAKAMGYNLVFAKGVLLYGGDDITDMIVKSVK